MLERLTMTQDREKLEGMTICEDCPCMNTDYERGSNCNLGYNMDSYWFRKSDGVVVKDTPEMRSHQRDFDLKYASKNCKLIKIITETEIPQDKGEREILDNVIDNARLTNGIKLSEVMNTDSLKTTILSQLKALRDKELPSRKLIQSALRNIKHSRNANWVGNVNLIHAWDFEIIDAIHNLITKKGER